MTADPAETNVIHQQFARFGSKCRTFAPMYRQLTLAGLRQRLSGGTVSLRQAACGTTTCATRGGRTCSATTRAAASCSSATRRARTSSPSCLRQEIDGKPIQKQLVGAYILGATFPVAKGKDAGGALQEHPAVPQARTNRLRRELLGIPLDGAAAGQHACSARPPIPRSRARARTPRALVKAARRCMRICSRRAGPLRWPAPHTTWVTGKTVDTPFVSVPGLLSAKCTSNEHATYLEITVNGDPVGSARPTTSAAISACLASRSRCGACT